MGFKKSRLNCFIIGDDFSDKDILKVVDGINDIPRCRWISAIFVYFIAKQFMGRVGCF